MILGRAVEQAAIDKFLSLVQTGEGGGLVLIGDPGMGKTTLLEWTAGSADSALTLRTSGHPSEADLPFVGLSDLLRPLQDRIALLPQPKSRVLESALSMSGADIGGRGAVNAAVLSLLDMVGQEAPLLLLVDDYHWLDSSSRAVIDFISRRTEPLGIGLMLTSRGGHPSDFRGALLRLEPLPPDIASELVLERAPVSPEVMRRIVSLAAGNPLALVELPLSITPQQVDASAPLNQPVTVSAAVENAYRTRLHDLPRTTRLALLLAAENPQESLVDFQRALPLLGLDLHSVDPAVAADLVIIEAGAIRFRHPLLRSVVHQTADREGVRRVHVALAEVVDDDDRRAWHLASAAVGPDETVAQALDGVAQRALGRGAAASAANSYQKAAELSEEPLSRGRRLAGAAKAAHQAGDMDRTSRIIEELRVSEGDSDIGPALLVLDSDIRMRRGDFAGAYGVLRLEADRVAEDAPGRAATMLLLASKLRVYRFEVDTALREVEEALALVPGNERDVVHLTALAMTKTMAGHEDARDAVILAMDTAQADPNGHIHTLGIGWPLVWLEEYDLARNFIDRSVDIQRRGGHLAYLPQALMAHAELNFRTGGWELARAHASEAMRLFDEGDQPTEAAMASSLLARLDAVTGDEIGCRQHAGAALQSDVGSGLRAATVHAESALGLSDLVHGDYPAAIEHLRVAGEICRSGGIGEPWLLPVDADLAESLIRSRNDAEALDIASDLRRRGEVMGRGSAVAAALRCLGLAAPGDSYREFFKEAIKIHAEIQTPFELARTALCYGERLRRSRNRVEARRVLRQAMAIFESLGAAPWVERARVELAASGETLQRRHPIAALTPQERQVASIVGSGATNREAAATLFVSPKTVEFHLGNVYRKLGVRSRTELANALNEMRSVDSGGS